MSLWLLAVGVRTFQWLSTRVGPKCMMSTVKPLPPPPPPLGLCCMSGCANCVWLEHADDLVKHFTDHGRGQDFKVEDLLAQVDEQIEDDMVKAFVKMEIKMKFKAKLKSV